MKKKWAKEDEQFLKDNQHLSRKELAKHFNVTDRAIKRKEQYLNLPPRKFQLEGSQPNRIGVEERVTYQTQLARKDKIIADKNAEVEIYQAQLESMRHELDAAFLFAEKPVFPFEIKSNKTAGGEATVVAVASDWHIEEEVVAETVNYKNKHNLEVSKERASKFFSVLLRLIEIEQQNTKVEHLILALLGDFITNDIHSDLVENTLLDPNEAIKRVEGYLVSGIDFLLKNSTLSRVSHVPLPCSAL